MNLKEIRADITQSALAKKSGIKQQRISEYELGVKSVENMTLGTARKISNALDMRVGDFVEKILK